MFCASVMGHRNFIVYSVLRVIVFLFKLEYLLGKCYVDIKSKRNG